MMIRFSCLYVYFCVTVTTVHLSCKIAESDWPKESKRDPFSINEDNLLNNYYKIHCQLKNSLTGYMENHYKRTSLKSKCYIIAEGYFLYYRFLFCISFGLVRLRTFRLSAWVGADINAGVHASARRMWQSQMSQ